MTRLIKLFAGGIFLFGIVQLRADEDTKPGEKVFDDTEFVQKAASGGMLEVDLGKLISGKAKTESVKSFAERMVTDHSKLGENLKKASASAGIPVPEMMNEKDQKEVDGFRDFKGTNIESVYIKHMVTDHEVDIALFARASKEAKNPAIRDFATNTLPVIQEHLKLAKKIQSMQ